MDRKTFKVCSVFDTETTNIGRGKDTRAICILYIFNDLRGVEISGYIPGESDDVRFYRWQHEALAYIQDLIEYGRRNELVPIVCGYNLMFDMVTLMEPLNNTFKMKATAQSSTTVYTLDILGEDDEPILRFWDTWFLEMNGLAAMGRTCGLPKASGDWDYSLVRAPQTPLTQEEIGYAKRDTQVIPAYLKWLMQANPFIREEDLGVKCLTKSSVVRLMAATEIGPLTVTTDTRSAIKLASLFSMVCRSELPKDFNSYALRKACFRGGFTFTAAKYSCRCVNDVASIDVTSMHHMFINGRYVPVKFRWMKRADLQMYCNWVLNTDTAQVLRVYHNPFPFAFHARVQFTNIRPKAGACFEEWGVSLIPQSRFCGIAIPDWNDNEANAEAESDIRQRGFGDRAKNAVFAFGKLVKAEIAQIHVTELELWCIAQVYDFDSCIVQVGEGTAKAMLPPDYVTLQSNKLFEQKTIVKRICNTYEEGKPYMREISPLVPESIARGLREGAVSLPFMKSYLQSTVKGAFNGIYGTQAMNLFRPDFQVQDGEVGVDLGTTVTPENFQDKLDELKRPKVLYTYGMRIVGGSRMHLVIAMQLLWDAFGKRITITGGDTDSLKIACWNDVTDDEILEALEPLHEASRKALSRVQERNRRNFPQLASDLHHIGEFEVENAGHHYKEHVDLWNKARVSYDGESVSVTCAGLSRPSGSYHIEHFLKDLMEQGHSFQDAVVMGMGFNTNIDNAICHSIEAHRPKVGERLVGELTDYTGNTYAIDLPQAIGLYSANRMLGDYSSKDNFATVNYMVECGHPLEHRLRESRIIGGKAAVFIMTEEGEIEWK